MKRVFLIALALAVSCLSLEAKIPKRKPANPAPAAKKAAPMQSAHRRSPYVGAISANAATGAILFEDNADREAYPASVTKLMTALLVLEDVKAGRYQLASRVTATDAVYKSEPSSVGLKAGQSMTVDDLLTALMVKSANDAAIALAVNSAGSTEAFVAKMNARAAALGMANTRYYNPNGLPPKPKYGIKSFNVSTCRDQLKLAMVMVKHPEIYKYTSQKIAEVTDGFGNPLKFVNHNNLMVKDKLKNEFGLRNADGRETVDGFKTGYIDAGGSSIVLTGQRNGKRAIVVVLGSATAGERDHSAGRLLVDALGAITF